MIWFDILIFAAVAAFLGWRLYTVLGERHGDERPRGNPFDPAQTPMKDLIKNIRNTVTKDTPVDAAGDRGEPGPVVVPPPPSPHAPDSLAGRLAAIEHADPNFNEKSFLAGARGAFGMIVEAFAAEDTATLRPLLSDDVYDSFAAAIRTRQAAGEKLETKITRIREAHVEDATLQINTARVTVRIVSDQIQVTRTASGEVLSGDPTKAREVVDIWTFSRNTRALDPNWALAGTRSGS